jgi:1-acyl-sn-glycerol-3-phosphate acyltransferase
VKTFIQNRTIEDASEGFWQGARLLEELWIPPVQSPARRAHGLRQLCRSLCRAHGIVPVVHGRIPDGPNIFVSNHKGYIDPIAICSATPAIPIAKAEVRSWPLLGSVAERYGTLFVERGDAFSGANVLRKCVRRLAGGASVLNFPEGTTTVGLPERFARGVCRAPRIRTAARRARPRLRR